MFSVRSIAFGAALTMEHEEDESHKELYDNKLSLSLNTKQHSKP